MKLSNKESIFIKNLLNNGVFTSKVKVLRSKNIDSDNIINDIETLLSGSRITSDRARFFRNELDITDKISSVGTNKHGRTNSYIRNDKLHSQLLIGGTFAMDSIDEFRGYFSSTTVQVSELLQCESSANLYVSYGNLTGFGYHKDDHHVLVRQLVGEKKWQFGDDMIDIVLKPGDLLFVPEGIAHNPISKSTKSFHVTYSIVKPNLKDFINWAAIKELDNQFKSLYINDKEACRERLNSLLEEFVKYRLSKVIAHREYNLTRMFPQ